MAQAKKKQSKWPLYAIGASAAVAVWSGWVGLGEKTGFGPVHLLPGIWNALEINTAITLPIGVEAYGAFALGTWIDRNTPLNARRFAKWSAIGSLGLGMLGQIAYHLLAAAHKVVAPWEIVTAVSCLPVITLGLAAGLHHLRGQVDDEPEQAELTINASQELTPAEIAQLKAELGKTFHVGQKPDLAETFTTPGGREHPVNPVAAKPAPMPTWPAPWEDPTWVAQPSFTPETPEPDPAATGTFTVRSPLGRAERKMPVDERIALRQTGAFPAVTD